VIFIKFTVNIVFTVVLTLLIIVININDSLTFLKSF
jgi:hypothetical protein